MLHLAPPPIRHRSFAPLLALALVALFARPGRAEDGRLLLVPFEGSNVHADLKVGLTEALVMFLKDEGALVSVAATGATLDQARAEARTRGATAVVVGRITRLGMAALIGVEVFALEGEAPVFVDRLDAASPEDSRTVLTRLARSIRTRKKAGGQETIHDVTEAEQSELRRVESNHNFGVRLGALAPSGPLESLMPGFDVFWQYDTRDFLVDLTLSSFGVGTDDFAFLMSVGAFYPFGVGTVAPYVGGGLALAGVEYEEPTQDEGYAYSEPKEAGGLLGFVGGGVLLGRTRSTQVRVDARYLLSSFETDSGDRIHGAILSMGIGL